MKYSWLDNPAFKNMDAAKQKIIIDLMKQTEGKSMNQALPVLISTMKSMNARGITFTNEERQIMLQILTADMSPQEKSKAKMMMNMMGNMNL